MKKKTKTKSILAILVIFISLVVCVATISVSADDSDCENIQYWLDYYEEMIDNFGCTSASTSTVCGIYYPLYESYYNRYQNNCVEEEPEPEPCKKLFDSDRMNYQYKVDNSPYYVTKVYVRATNELAFCAEPDVARKDCHDDYYTVSADDLTSEELIRISLAAMFYFEEPSDTHYVAAQMYIWVVITGEEWTVNGHDISYYWPELEQKIEDALNGSLSDVELETSIVETESVEIEFQYSNIMVDLNSTFTNVDVNGNLTNEYFTLTITPTGPDGQGDNTTETASINDSTNAVTGTNQNIWPSVKTYVVDPVTDSVTEIIEEVDGNLIGTGTYYISATSQNIFSFDGALQEGISLGKIITYTGSTFTTTLKTGSLSLTKVDEWNQNARSVIHI